MSKFRLSKRSEENLRGVHPDLVKVVHRALEITDIDFMVIEGKRNE
ncbi:M15 family peptidase, partial [Proteus sp. G2672]|nr:M15 family peptidase [Proteus sp. G2672]